MVVVVTMLVAIVLGTVAYDYSTDMSEALRVQVAAMPGLDASTAAVAVGSQPIKPSS